MKYYLAYGSNLNMQQMGVRCPGATFLGTTELPDYELQFKGAPDRAYATISPMSGASVPVGIWEITEEHELELDIYEGYPLQYFKETVSVVLDGKPIEAMVYIMHLQAKFGVPSDLYYTVVAQGYKDCGMDLDRLKSAAERSILAYCAADSSDM